MLRRSFAFGLSLFFLAVLVSHLSVTVVAQEESRSAVESTVSTETAPSSEKSNAQVEKKKSESSPEESAAEETSSTDEASAEALFGGGVQAMSMGGRPTDDDANAAMPTQTNPSRPYSLSAQEITEQQFVNLSTGAAEVKLPLQVPQGMNGLTPDLTLEYSSHRMRDNGPFGHGWQIDLGQIRRLSKSGSDKLYTAPIYYLSLGGLQGELVKTGTNGTDDLYAFRRESAFARIIHDTSNDLWTVTTTDGTEFRLGANSDSRYDNTEGFNGDSSKVYAWYLDLVTDTNGHTMVYEYVRKYNLLYPKSIRYGSAGSDQSSSPFQIRFTPQYSNPTGFCTNRSDHASFGYQTGFWVRYCAVVTSVEVWVQGTKQLEYLLHYRPDHVITRTDLDSLKVKGYGTVNLEQEMTFDYYAQTDGVDSSDQYIRKDLLKQITFDQGGEVIFDYKPAWQFTTSPSVSANPRPHFPIAAVNSLTREDFTGRSDEMEYFYADGSYYFESAVNREIAGFGRTTVTDPFGQKTVHFFHQAGGYDGSSLGEHASDNWYLMGRRYRVETYDASSKLMKREITHWESSSLGTNREFVRAEGMVTTVFNTGGAGRSTAVEYSYDSSNGNLTEQFEYGEVSASDNGTFTDVGNDDRKTVISYASNTTDHLLAYPQNQKFYDENNTLISEQSYRYDGLALGSVNKGNRTHQIQEFFEETRQITTEWQYNANGQVTKAIDARSNETTITYDTLSLYPATVTNDLSQVTSYSYDITYGQMTQMTDPNGLVVAVTLDSLGRVVEQEMTDPAQSDQLTIMQEMVYQETSTPHSVLTKISLDASTTADSYGYLDGFGRVIQTRAEDDSGQYIVSNTVYDALGRVIEQTLPVFASGTAYNWAQGSATKTSTSYDVLNRPTQVQDANGTTSISHDRWDRTVNDPNGNDKSFESDAYGRLITVEEEESSTIYTTSYQYDARDLITKLTDAEGNVRHFDYDSLGRLIEQEDLHDSADGTFGTWEYDYDDVGNVTKVTDPKAQEIDYLYDDLNRLTNEQLTGQSSTAFTYTYDTGTNQKGRLTSIIGPGHSWSASYDKRGRVTSELNVIDTVNYSKSYTYTRFDQPVTMSYPDGIVVTNTYSGVGQLETVVTNQGNVIDDLAYSPLSQVKTIDYANGLVSKMTYDASKMYRMTAKVTEDDAQTTFYQNLAYSYDNVGNITNLSETAGLAVNKTAVYVYDDLYRLTSATITNTTSGGNYTRTLSYSAIGNILSKSDQGDYTYAETGTTNPQAVTQIVGDFGFGYGYGGTGNDTKDYTYDDNGNMTQELITVDGGPTITKNFSWDHNNRMTQTTVSDGTTTTTVTYTYDQGGRRLKKVSDDGTTTTTTLYPYADYEVTSTATTKVTISADSLHVATMESTATPTYDLFFHHDDHLGGANIVTDASATVTQVIDYYPFGTPRVDVQSASYDSTQKFTGHELDASTELYYAKARYYNSEIGRFISQDPLSRRPGEQFEMFQRLPQALNTYSYAINSPIILTDATGEVVWMPLFIAGVWFMAEVADYAITTYDAYNFVTDPSSETFGPVAYNAAFAALPGNAVVGKMFRVLRNTVGKITVKAPKGFRFTQKTAGRFFQSARRNPGDFKYKGWSVDEVVDGIKNGAIDPNDIPVQYVEIDGVKYIADTRSASTIIEAGLDLEQHATRTTDPTIVDIVKKRLSRKGHENGLGQVDVGELDMSLVESNK